MEAPAPSPDLAIGSYSERGPWVVDPDAMPWRADVARRRAQARDEFPNWLHPGTLPPIGRVARVVSRVGSAIAGWYLIDRRGGVVAGRHGLSRRLRHAFAALGPTYIKLGQIISGGEGLFPPELVAEFKLLRDRVPAEPFDVVRRVVELDLGRSLDDVFERFERTPIAAASIAQVHAARLRTGEEVVVKVQRPQVARLVREDIRAMSWLAPRLVGRIPVAALANPPALVELFAETIVEELDFCLEAENMLDIARVLAETEQRATIVPRPHPTLVTRRVLVMERLDGIPWDDVVAMKEAGVDTEAVLHAGLVSFMEGAMLYGVFHGDLHGGNLMVQPDGRTVLMDFGITGRLDEAKRLAFLMLLVGATSGDTMAQLGALRDLGAFPPDTDLHAVFKDLGLDRTIDPTMLSADELVHELQDLTKKLLEYGARAPKELMLFVKNMMFLDGAIARLAPDLDILEEVQRVHTEIAARHGVRLANELGIDPALTAQFDMDAVKAAMGVPDVERLTYREVQERREIVRQRLEQRRKRAERPLMTTFEHDDVEAAFRNYWQLGAVGEDWDAWCDQCFTDDVTYIEHVLGSKQGREAVREWIKPTMEEYGAIYTAYEWHMVAPDGRVVVYMQNRRDHPDTSQAPIDFPGMTVLQYAGGGQFSLEEDFWSLPEGIETAKRSAQAYRDVDPGFPNRRTRRDWGRGPAWTRGASTYAESRGARRAQ